MAVYLDCAATTPVDPRVAEAVRRFMEEEFGNSGSRTHEFGTRARRAVEVAREQVARVVAAGRGEVIFTSGATEANNLAILGLAAHGQATGKRHIVTTKIEHHAVLGPVEAMKKRGFEVSFVPPTPGGWVDPQAVMELVRPDTLLVSIMHVNNETGVIQPIEEIAGLLGEHPAYLHVDGAQGYGKLGGLEARRIDLISISGHKIHAPKGIGALVTRRREGKRPPLEPLMHGGGQELGLRPGTLPVQLVVGLGLAAELALGEMDKRAGLCRQFRETMMAGLAQLSPTLIGEPSRSVPHIVSLAFPAVDAEDAIEALAGLVAVSTGAACTTASRTCSHVLEAMGVGARAAAGAMRFSWCHMTPEVEWSAVVNALEGIGISGR